MGTRQSPRFYGKWNMYIRWKLKKGNLTQTDLGGQQGEPSCSTTGSQLGIQEQKMDPAHRYFTIPAGGRKAYLLTLAKAQPIRDSRNLANEKPPYFQLPVYSNGLFVYNSLPNFPPPPQRSSPAPLSSGRACGFAPACSSRAAILCYSQINPFLLVKQWAVLYWRLTIHTHSAHGYTFLFNEM